MAKRLDAEDRDEQVGRSTRVASRVGIERRSSSQIESGNQVRRAHNDSDTVGRRDLRSYRSGGERSEAWRLRRAATLFESHLATVMVHGRAAHLLCWRHFDGQEARRRRDDHQRDCHRSREKSASRSHAWNHCVNVHLHPPDSNCQFRANPSGSPQAGTGSLNDGPDDRAQPMNSQRQTLWLHMVYICRSDEWCNHRRRLRELMNVRRDDLPAQASVYRAVLFAKHSRRVIR